MWLAFLPFSLWDACHWVTIPASGIIGFLLLGIEEIGVQIEEPFGILPLGVPASRVTSLLWPSTSSVWHLHI
jgi:predicted membrane chloride channel (bestrophin family)